MKRNPVNSKEDLKLEANTAEKSSASDRVSEMKKKPSFLDILEEQRAAPEKSSGSDDSIDTSNGSGGSANSDGANGVGAARIVKQKKKHKNTTTSPLLSEAIIPSQVAAENFEKTSSLEHMKGVYEIRYGSKIGEASAFEQKFAPDRLVIDGEKAVVDQALTSILPSVFTRVTNYKKVTEAQFEEARKEENEKARKEQLAKLTAELKPITLKALDFGSGDGRALEIWIDLADRVKPHGITLEVTAYDIVRSGVDSYKSKLTHPRLPQEYVDDLKEIYGERVYQARQRDPEFLKQEDRYDEDLKKLYERDLPKDEDSEVYGAELPDKRNGEVAGRKLSRPKRPAETSDDLSDIFVDFSPNAAALKKQYGEELYEKRKVADGFPSVLDYAALRAKYQETIREDFIEACQLEGQPFTEDYALEYARNKAVDKVDSLRKRMPKFPALEQADEDDRSLYASDFIEGAKREPGEEALIEDCGAHQRDNLKIKFLLGSPKLDPQDLNHMLGEGESFDLSLILYGCLSHIPTAEKRDSFLESIRDMTHCNGRVAMTVPGQIFFKEDLKQMDWMVKNGLLPRSKVRPGDVIYTATDITDAHIKDSGATESETQNLRSLFFATYSPDQLKEWVEKMSPDEYKLFISSLANPSTVSNSGLAFRTADRIASQILSAVMDRPEFAKYIDAGYYGVGFPGTAEKEAKDLGSRDIEEVETSTKKSETPSFWRSLVGRFTTLPTSQKDFTR